MPLVFACSMIFFRSSPAVPASWLQAGSAPGSDGPSHDMDRHARQKNLPQDFRSDSSRATRDEDDPVRLDLP